MPCAGALDKKNYPFREGIGLAQGLGTRSRFIYLSTFKRKYLFYTHIIQ